MIELSKSTFQRIAQVAKRESGIDLSDSKVGMVHARLRRRVRSLGFTDYEGYCDILEGSSSSGADERQNLIDALTTNVTSFFREPHHFSLLIEKMQTIFDEDPRYRFRIWSAGCSDGAEPLSVCLSIAKRFPDLDPNNVDILATDIDSSALGRARENLYPKGELSTEGKPLYDMRHIRLHPPNFSLDKDWFDRISYRRENLLKPHKPAHCYDAIFCRNVTIYFDVEASGRVQRNLLNALNPGGLLCLGHSERIVDQDCLDRCVRVGPSAYVKSTKEDHNVSS